MNELFGDTRECDGGSLGPSLTIRRNTQSDDRRVVPQSVVTIKLTYEIQPVVAAYILFNGGQSHYSPTETTPVHHTPSCLTVRGVVYVETRYLDSVRDYDRSELRSARTVERRRRKIGLTISNIGRVSRKRPLRRLLDFIPISGVLPSLTVINCVSYAYERTVFFLVHIRLRNRRNVREKERLGIKENRISRGKRSAEGNCVLIFARIPRISLPYGRSYEL